MTSLPPKGNVGGEESIIAEAEAAIKNARLKWVDEIAELKSFEDSVTGSSKLEKEMLDGVKRIMNDLDGLRQQVEEKEEMLKTETKRVDSEMRKLFWRSDLKQQRVNDARDSMRSAVDKYKTVLWRKAKAKMKEAKNVATARKKCSGNKQ